MNTFRQNLSKYMCWHLIIFMIRKINVDKTKTTFSRCFRLNHYFFMLSRIFSINVWHSSTICHSIPFTFFSDNVADNSDKLSITLLISFSFACCNISVNLFVNLIIRFRNLFYRCFNGTIYYNMQSIYIANIIFDILKFVLCKHLYKYVYINCINIHKFYAINCIFININVYFSTRFVELYFLTLHTVSWYNWNDELKYCQNIHNFHTIRNIMIFIIFKQLNKLLNCNYY